jgi:hypothetical protein
MRRGALALAAVLLSGCARVAAPGPGASEAASDEFGVPQLVTIEGWDSDAMEPFLSRDGRLLFFNDSNAPRHDTNLFYAEREDDLHFRFKGPVRGANSPALDGVASMDRSGRFYFTTVRDYAKSLRTLYCADFKDSAVSPPRPVLGDFARLQPGWLTMDAEISADGSTLYYSDARFGKGPIPVSSHLGIASRGADGSFTKTADYARVLEKVTSAAELEYAPATSPDGLKLYFTRLTPGTLRTRILAAERRSLSEPFGPPKVVIAAAPGSVVEAPTVAPDGRALYFHKKDGARHRLYRVERLER